MKRNTYVCVYTYHIYIIYGLGFFMYIYVPESLCFTPETNAVLLMQYNEVLNILQLRDIK